MWVPSGPAPSGPKAGEMKKGKGLVASLFFSPGKTWDEFWKEYPKGNYLAG